MTDKPDCVSCHHPYDEHVSNEVYVANGQLGFRGGCRMDWSRWPPGEDCVCYGYLKPKTADA